MSVGGEEPCDMMDFVGQLSHVVEVVWMCVPVMWPLYLGVFIILCR
jgi:hypothetical protein